MRALVVGLACLIVTIVGLADDTAKSNASPQGSTADAAIAKPRNIEEARSRAKLLFELAVGSLQVMHRDFFDDENPRAIPSASLDDVFAEMKAEFAVEMKWLNTGTDVVNTDHQPQSDFEMKAANLLGRGEKDAEELNQTEYRFAGSITLRSQCLKCHLKDRKSNADRYAALVIKMPVQP